MKRFRLGVAQWDSSASSPLDENVARMEQAFVRAGDAGVELLLFPEVFLSGYPDDPEAARRRAVPLDDPAVRRAVSLTRRFGTAACFGMFEREGQDIYNAAVLADRGELVGVQRKMHIPAREQGFFTPGDAFRVFALPFVTVGIGICFDNEISETHTILALLGAELILMPAAWSERWERLDYIEPCRTDDAVLRERQRWAAMMFGARCRDTGTYSALANRCGLLDAGPWRFPGKSMIVAPTGRVLAEAAAWEEDLICADLDAGVLARYRSMPCYTLRERRPGVYTPLVDAKLKDRWPRKIQPGPADMEPS
ncbi:MAG: carbon-nitrogen hydrolase family protein [Lentisphaerae bacterium]|nr:carbon-nitrogen hydrolase family protein [Lentisphaerota bacterium]